MPGRSNDSPYQGPTQRILHGVPPILPRRLTALRGYAAQLTDHREQKGCGHRIRKGKTGTSAEVLEVIKTCKRKWHCPVCAYTASLSGADVLKRRIGRWTAEGGGVAFLTLTQMHQLEDSLDELWSRLEGGWSPVTHGAAWARDKASFGILGHVRVTEIVHQPCNGWHPHYHVVLFLDRPLDLGQLEPLKSSVARRFLRGVHHAGGLADLRGQHIRPFEHGSHETLANYCFKGLKIRTFQGQSRTPMAILRDLEATGEGFGLWSEFTQAATSGRRQLTVSQHIDRIHPSSFSYLIKEGTYSTTKFGDGLSREQELMEALDLRPVWGVPLDGSLHGAEGT